MEMEKAEISLQIYSSVFVRSGRKNSFRKDYVMYQNYIFDLYGTLVDIRTNEKKAYLWKKFAVILVMLGAEYTPSELRQRYQLLVREKQRELLLAKQKEKKDTSLSVSDVEIKLEDVFAQLLSDRGALAGEERVRDAAVFFRALSLERLALFEGVERLFAVLHQKGKNIYLLSNAQRIFTEPEMRKLKLYDAFDGILYSSDIGFQKPSGYFYKALLEQYSLKKEESVMIGNDRYADVEGAHRLGMDSVYIHTEQSTPFTDALPSDCIKIQRISEVENICAG
jgi:putative hydrolase of the HAD superfamily